MQVIDMPVSELREYENNPRLNDDAVEPVAMSIERFGFKVPCVIDANNVIVTGHTRLKAARLLGMDTVPCIVADDLTDEQVRAFRIADNKVAEIAQWDIDALNIELGEIELDMGDFGFIDMDGISLEDVEEDDFDVEEAIESVSEPRVKRGQVWRLGDHYLMCGDSTNPDDVAKLMSAGGKAHLLLTDPPYNVAYEGKTEKALKIENDSMAPSEFRTFLEKAFKNASDHMEEGAAG